MTTQKILVPPTCARCGSITMVGWNFRDDTDPAIVTCQEACAGRCTFRVEVPRDPDADDFVVITEYPKPYPWDRARVF